MRVVLIPRTRALLFAALAGLAALAGCGAEADQPAGADEGGATVVATSGFVADITAAVAGDDAAIVQLVPDGASPHSHSPSARQRAGVAGADLIVAVGRGYEEALGLEAAGPPVLALADHAGGGADPHVWMDPTRIAAAVPALVGALARADPGHAADHERRGVAYAARLRALDRELRDTLAAVPNGRRKLVTSHDSLRHFADRYDFRVVAAPFGVQPEAEASAEAIARVIAAVRRERVPVVFAQQGDDPKVMRQIAGETGVRVVDDLLVENPGRQATEYEAALRFDARRIAGALSGR